MTPTEITVAEKAKSGKKPAAAWVFFQRWMANPLSMGSIIPSASGLQNLVRDNVKCSPDQIVVEFGGGTGAITKALLKAGVPGDRIYSVEIDGELADYLKRVYPDVNVLHGDCRNIDTMIPAEMIGKVGTLVVGIPMVMLPLELQKEIVAAIFRVLPPGGHFLLYTYCITSPLDMKALGLTGKRMGWTPKNFPPASVWAYSKA